MHGEAPGRDAWTAGGLRAHPLALPFVSAELFIQAGALLAERAVRSAGSRIEVEAILRRASDQVAWLRGADPAVGTVCHHRGSGAPGSPESPGTRAHSGDLEAVLRPSRPRISVKQQSYCRPAFCNMSSIATKTSELLRLAGSGPLRTRDVDAAGIPLRSWRSCTRVAPRSCRASRRGPSRASKTVADCFRYRRHVGLEVALAAPTGSRRSSGPTWRPWREVGAAARRPVALRRRCATL